MRALLLAFLLVHTALAEQTAWITDLGGTFQKDKAGRIIEVDLTSTWVTDDDLGKLAAMPELQKINLSATKIGDIGFSQLRPLHKVTYLNCFHCPYLTDGAIAYIKHWKNLEYLNVRWSEVTSRVFEQ